MQHVSGIARKVEYHPEFRMRTPAIAWTVPAEEAVEGLKTQTLRRR